MRRRHRGAQRATRAAVRSRARGRRKGSCARRARARRARTRRGRRPRGTRVPGYRARTRSWPRTHPTDGRPLPCGRFVALLSPWFGEAGAGSRPRDAWIDQGSGGCGTFVALLPLWSDHGSRPAWRRPQRSALAEWVSVVEAFPDALRLAGFLARQRAGWQHDHVGAHPQTVLELTPQIVRDRIRLAVGG